MSLALSHLYSHVSLPQTKKKKKEKNVNECGRIMQELTPSGNPGRTKGRKGRRNSVKVQKKMYRKPEGKWKMDGSKHIVGSVREKQKNLKIIYYY